MQAERGERGAAQERLGRNGVAMRTDNGFHPYFLYSSTYNSDILKPKNRQNQLGNAAFFECLVVDAGMMFFEMFVV